MNYKLSADETACVKKLAKLFGNGDLLISDDFQSDPNSPSHPLELRADNRESILTLMEHMEIITDVQHTFNCRFSTFRIDAKSVQVAREIAEQERQKDEPRDIVEHVKTIAKRNRFFAWAIIVFLILTAVVTFLHQLIQLLKDFGVLKAD